MKLRVLAGVAAAGLLSACAVQPPGVLATPTLVPTPTSSTSPTFTPTPTPVETAPETPVETTTPTPIPTTNGQILLGGNHLGNFKFEAGETEVMSWLRAELGEPTDIFEDPFCYFTEKTPYSLQATWGGLTVVFLAKDSEPTSPRTLQAWSFGLSKPLPKRFALEDGADTDMSFASLQQTFPEATLTKNPIGENVLTLPNGIRLIGGLKPEQVASGFDDPECIG